MGQIPSISPSSLNSKFENPFDLISQQKSKKIQSEISITIKIDTRSLQVKLNLSATIGYLISQANRLSLAEGNILALRSENSLEMIDCLLVSYEKPVTLIPASETFSAVFSQRISQKLEIRNFSPIKIIGKGGFSLVTMARKKDTCLLYAIKTVNKEYIINQNKVKHILCEKDILSKVTHPFIIQFYGSFQTVNDK